MTYLAKINSKFRVVSNSQVFTFEVYNFDEVDPNSADDAIEGKIGEMQLSKKEVVELIELGGGRNRGDKKFEQHLHKHKLLPPTAHLTGSGDGDWLSSMTLGSDIGTLLIKIKGSQQDDYNELHDSVFDD